MGRIKTTTVGACGILPYKQEIAAGLTLRDRFDQPYKLYRQDGDDIWIPRGIATAEHTKYDMGTPVEFEDNFVPRHDDQARVVQEARHLLTSGEDFILQAPTGYGKTYVGAATISSVGRRALVITTKEDIIPQWSKALRECCGLTPEQIGVWRGDQIPLPSHKVVVGLVQSIMKGPERYGTDAYRGFGFVIPDEVHRMGAEHFSQSMWWLPAYLRMGLSATPDRKDGRMRVITSHIGRVRVQAKQDVMIPKIIVQPTHWKVPMVHWYGSYQKQPHTAGKTMGVEKAMYTHLQRNQIIARFCYVAYRKARTTIIFSSGLEHLRSLENTLVMEGIPPHQIGWYVGLQNYPKGIPKEQKLLLREQSKTKPIILATYSMASEATDIPWLDTCVLATPRADVVQIVGRIRREWEGKRQPVVLDLVDSDSRVFAGYYKARLRWYQSIGAPVIHKPGY